MSRHTNTAAQRIAQVRYTINTVHVMAVAHDAPPAACDAIERLCGAALAGGMDPYQTFLRCQEVIKAAFRSEPVEGLVIDYNHGAIAA
jgi:hypothetical protein